MSHLRRRKLYPIFGGYVSKTETLHKKPRSGHRFRRQQALLISYRLRFYPASRFGGFCSNKVSDPVEPRVLFKKDKFMSHQNFKDRIDVHAKKTRAIAKPMLMRMCSTTRARPVVLVAAHQFSQGTTAHHRRTLCGPYSGRTFFEGFRQQRSDMCLMLCHRKGVPSHS